MKIFLCLLFATIVTSTPLSAQDWTDELADMPELQFDKKQEAPLITFRTFGGFRMAPPAGFIPDPRLRVFADGTVKVGKHHSRAIEASGKLSRAELYELLEFVVIKNKIFKCNTNEIAESLKRVGGKIHIADAPSSGFDIAIGKKKHTVEVYALQFIGKQYAQVQELAQLVRIEKRMNRVAGTIVMGGRDSVDRVLVQVNAQLKKQRADLSPLDSTHLVNASRNAKGDLFVNFYKAYGDGDEKKLTRVNVNYVVRSNQKPKLNVFVLKPRN